MAKKHTPNTPEKKFGPFQGGISVAVWINTIQTDAGPRQTRSITISPKRYRDPKTDEWKDSYSYKPSDLPFILHGLQSAWRYVVDTPLPDQEDGE